MTRAPWKAGGVAVLVTLASVALAYQLPAVIEIDLGRSFPGAIALDNFHDQEPGYRWTRATSTLVFHDPGGFQDATLELELAGFRPRGTEPPLVIVEAGSERARFEPTRRIASYTLDTRTSGWWSSDLDVTLRSETFTAGGGDERSLGARVHRARLTLPGGAAPPLRQLLWSAALVGLAFGWWRARRYPLAAGASLGVAVAIGYGLARASTTLLVPTAAVALGTLTLVRWWLPSWSELAGDVGRASSRAFVATAALDRRRAVALGVLTVLAVAAAYRSAPRVVVDLGTDEPSGISRRFGPLDRDGDVTFQIARAGATLDSSELGWGHPWSVTVYASSSTATSGVVLVAGEHQLRTEVGADWARYQMEVPAPSVGFSPAPVLSFPGLGGGRELRIDRVEIDRGASLPPLRTITLVLGATFFVATALGSTLAGGVVAALVTMALVRAPVMTIPFLPTLVAGSVATVVVGALARGVVVVGARRKFLPELEPVAISIALGGLVLWFVALASPLYVGGHYGFHTNIAEEISQGHFLLYYLPYPGSMLSRQPQWENLIVPHSCLFHTADAPFALLPRVWFHTTTKLILAALLFGIALSSSLVATRIASPRAGGYAALAGVFIPTGFQLLGLGHLMTLFGTWAAALALGFLTIHLDALAERAVLVWATALVTLCFLSYTGSLLFASITLVATAALCYRRDRALSRRLATIVVIAWGAAFLLYYIHWTLPFVRDSLPALFSSGGDGGIDVWARIASQPRKLAYTFGSAVVPLVGLAGLGLARGERRTLLLGWGSILVVFSGLDIFFNFLLKHHYFTFPAIAIGVGLMLGWLHEKSWILRAISALFVVSLVWMGFREALAVVRGAY